MIGDSDTDIQAGRRAGCHAIKVAPVDGALLDAVNALGTAKQHHRVTYGAIWEKQAN